MLGIIPYPVIPGPDLIYSAMVTRALFTEFYSVKSSLPSSRARAGHRSWASSTIKSCVVIDKTTHTGVFVIPGLTRNPVRFQSFKFLDAGSSPA